MKTPEQLKGKIRNVAKEKDLHAQEVLQMYLFERVIERLSASRYKANFILKGGLLIASMIGIAERTTMDMDTTVNGVRMEEETIKRVIKEVLATDVGDGIEFIMTKIEPIYEVGAYNNFRVSFNALYGKMNVPMKIDITTGDIITPSAIEYSYQMMFETKSVSVMAYTLETILAEKYETIIGRNIGNTRARDFYDLYVIFKSRKSEINRRYLVTAVEATSKKRGSESVLSDWKEICEEIKNEEALMDLWNNYIEDNRYADYLSFSDVADNVYNVAKYINEI